ncbi:spermidine/putrescine ABC transporter substrate-binding protein [candidate division KSB1 bacterium]|nr:spermidine/putrescine ABC transporter substrate-binding protein [candidate division KSB1 bacterium]
MTKQLAMLACSAILLLSCSREQRLLNVYNWADYVDPEMIARFEQENNCRVVEDTFDSNEAMYAKLKAGATGYDVIMPSSYMVDVMREQDMLLPLDQSKIPNLKNVDSSYIDIISDPRMTYSVPWALSITGLAYLRHRVPNVDDSWAMLDRADLQGRITLLDDMRETIGAALKYLGFSLNTTDEAELADAKQVVIRWKKNIATFENEQYKNGIASEEFLLVHGYSRDILQVVEENEEIAFFAPREGASVAMDEMVIPRDAPHADLAHAFINFMLQGDVAAKNIEFTAYLFPNTAAYPLLDEELRNDPILFPPAEAIANMEAIIDLGEENVKYTKVWDEIKAAK